jgi:sterol desaturase/sphingolipid hydroxylase (fatty acid hydroxylase superfamily)
MFTFFEWVFKKAEEWGFGVVVAIVAIVSVVELAFKLYESKWNKNESAIDVFCLVSPFIIIRPMLTYLSIWLVAIMFPHAKNIFAWVPFWWAFFIIVIIEDLTIYWMHRLHHQIPWLWRFHRTHHSAPYMGIAMAGRENFLANIYLSFTQIFLIIACTYFGLGIPAVVVTVFKTLVIWGAHSSIPWDKPLYKYKVLHPFAWVFERLISTPATHYAHHADTSDDGIGYYKGNFASVFFIWDIIFKTGKITRKYPERVGLKHYKNEEWYVQLLWPIFKSKQEGSELAKNAAVDMGQSDLKI